MTLAKSTFFCSCRGPDFNSQNLFGDSQVTVTPAPENLMPSSGLPWHVTHVHTPTHRHTRMAYTQFLYVISTLCLKCNFSNKEQSSKQGATGTEMGWVWGSGDKRKAWKHREKRGSKKLCISLAKNGEGSILASRKKTPGHLQLEDVCFNRMHNSTWRSKALPDGKWGIKLTASNAHKSRPHQKV